MSSQRAEYDSQDRSAYAILDGICRRKVIHRFSVYVGHRERKSIFAHGIGQFQ